MLTYAIKFSVVCDVQSVLMKEPFLALHQGKIFAAVWSCI